MNFYINFDKIDPVLSPGVSLSPVLRKRYLVYLKFQKCTRRVPRVKDVIFFIPGCELSTIIYIELLKPEKNY